MNNSMEENLILLYSKTLNESRKSWIDKFKSKVVKNPETGRENTYGTILNDPDNPLHQKVAKSYEETKDKQEDKEKNSKKSDKDSDKIEQLKKEIEVIEKTFSKKVEALRDKAKVSKEDTDNYVGDNALAKGYVEKERSRAKIEYNQKVLSLITDVEKKNQIKELIKKEEAKSSSIKKALDQSKKEAEEKLADNEVPKSDVDSTDGELYSDESPKSDVDSTDSTETPEERTDLMSSGDSDSEEPKAEDPEKFKMEIAKEKEKKISDAIKSKEEQLAKETDEEKKKELEKSIKAIKKNKEKIKDAIEQIKNKANESYDSDWWPIFAMFSIVENQLRDLEDTFEVNG